MLANPVTQVSVGAPITGATASEVFFAAAGGVLAQDVNFLWDSTHHWLGIGITPAYPLHVEGAAGFVSRFTDGVGDVTITVNGAANQGVGTVNGSIFYLRCGSSNWFSMNASGHFSLGNNAGAFTSSMLLVTSIGPTNACIELWAAAGQAANIATFSTNGGVQLSAVDASGRWVNPTVAGAPTGTPTVGTQIFDTTNSKLWIYTAAGWKGVVLA